MIMLSNTLTKFTYNYTNQAPTDYSFYSPFGSGMSKIVMMDRSAARSTVTAGSLVLRVVIKLSGTSKNLSINSSMVIHSASPEELFRGNITVVGLITSKSTPTNKR